MRLEWLRQKSELKDVLIEPRAGGPEIAYWIFSGLSKADWYDMTIIAAGQYGKEYVKTFGHYHTPQVLETYKLISGEGVFVLQKKHFEKGKWIPEMVDEVYMVKPAVNEE
jgi:hypothetical protein